MASQPVIGPAQASTFLDMSIYNAQFPSEGAKVVPVPLNFSLQTAFTIDLTLLQQRGFVKSFQSVFVDNSASVVPITISIGASNQRVVIPGSSQGVVPIFVPSNPVFTVSSAGGVVVPLFFCNVPLPAAVWPATQSFLFTSSGYLEVSDVALDGCIVSGNVNTTPNLIGNNNVVKPFFAADELYTGSTSATAAVTLITGSPSWFITDVFVHLTGDAAMASAGELTVSLIDDATTILEGIAYVPAASPVILGSTPLIESRALQYNSKNSASTLTIKLGTALTSGKVFWNVAGGLCANVGP